MNEFLLEIFSEEIPARMQLQAQKDCKATIEKILQEKKAIFDQINTFAAPQRLVIHIPNLSETTEDLTETRRGPKVDAPQVALDGFVKSTGKVKEQLIEKDGYWFAELIQTGQKIIDLFPQIMEELLDQMPWPKSMRWHNHQLNTISRSWIRPIRSLACVYQEKPIIFNVPSIGLTTNNITYGHRLLAPQSISVTNFNAYTQELKDVFVVLDHQERQNIIKKNIQEQAASKGLKLKYDENLLQEVGGLVDFPFVHIGKIEEKFMHLPAVVLSTSMRKHQKYFTLLNQDNTFAPFFGVVTNYPAQQNNRTMLEGLERVLRARLSDASFFYETDRKNSLQDLVPRLNNIIFHAKLGSVGQKIERLISLMPTDSGKRAALLCKADLVTEMVGEFPELQGIMGEIYALNKGENKEVAAAIKEHYSPQGPHDPCPKSPLSYQIGMTDKIDTVVGFIGVRIRPTGSKDPFGIRRAALGIIRLIVENRQKDLFIDTLIQQAIMAYKNQFVVLIDNTFEEVIKFIYERFSVYLKDQHIDYDCVNAILHNQSNNQNKYNLWSLAERAKLLHAFLKTDSGQALKIAYRRAAGILSTSSNSYNINPSLLQEDAEKKLFEIISQIQEDFDLLINTHNYTGIMEQPATVRASIDRFFDTVTVNCEDKQLCQNRYALLKQFINLVNQIADFSNLEG